MYKKSLTLLMLVLSLSVIASLPVASATEQFPPDGIPNKNDIYWDTIGMPETVDPAWLYDTASATIAMNVYDTLIFFNYEKSDEFVPSIALDTGTTVTPSIDSGFDHSILFKIREGVKWQDYATTSDTVTPADVEYTFERWMVFDRTGGPTWMIYEALMGAYGADTSWANDTSNPIATHVQSNSTHVWFNFDSSYSETIFKQVIAQSWAGILDQDWAAAQGCWPGTWNNWLDYHDPSISPLDDPAAMMGAGPYAFDWITYPDVGWHITRFADYWGGWPAPGCSDYAETVTMTIEDIWANRKRRFLSNDPADQADLTYVPRANTGELESPTDYVQGLGAVRYIRDVPTVTLSPAIFFNFHIPTEALDPGYGSPYIGNELFSEYGTPSDFFADPNVRYGFSYAFDYATFIAEVLLGEANQPGSPLIRNVGFDDLYDTKNPELLAVRYNYNLTKAEESLKAAWPTRVGEEGQTGLWNTGFTMTITYNTGSAERETACTMFKSALEGMNSKFHVNIGVVDWHTYLGDLVNYPNFHTTMPLFLIGWIADYPDPHNFMAPFYATWGDFTFFQDWATYAPDTETVVDNGDGTYSIVAGSNGVADCDEKIDAALYTYGSTDEETHELRKALYSELMDDWIVDDPTIPLIQALGRHYERTWVQGWYDNPIYPGPYFYHYWKGLDGDVLATHSPTMVDVFDMGAISSHWTVLVLGVPTEIGPAGYDRVADISSHTTASWNQTAGYPTYGLMDPYDGLVDQADLSYAQAHWGDTYTP